MRRNIRALWQLVRANPTAAWTSYRVAKQANNLHAIQKIREFAPFLAYVSRHKPLRTIVEIGSSLGGSFYAWCLISASDGLIVSIDLPGGDWGDFSEEAATRMRQYRRETQQVESLLGDSHDPQTLARLEQLLRGRKIDLLFIDGDHSYEGVRQDFEMYAPLASLVALHDILPHPAFTGCEVERFWRELRERHRCIEFLDPEDDRLGWGLWGGIGVILDPP